jgi:hypothetical protein
MVMMVRTAWLWGLAFSLATPALAQQIITSPEAESVSLTVYRASGRGQQPINANWPDGYALITETRTVRIPAGESLVRFEGVAEGMFPESAIVTGLPKGVKEKNRDARLLSPSGLVDSYLKRAVTITRTDKATGKTVSSDAMITAGPNGGVILQTGAGYEALRCTGLPERMSFGGLPADLSAKPTLSIITQSDRDATVKLTLTYMAAGFDWQANYVAQVRDAKPGEVLATGKGKVDIFAWLTLANGGNQSFVHANTMAIAGEPNRVNRGAQARPTGGALTLRCWPAQRTHEVPFRPGWQYVPEPPPLPVSMMSMAESEGADIIVTAQKRSRDKLEQASPVAVVVAEQEDLGDLKLYRVPEPVTVNAKGQKQVAMIVKPGASFDRVYTANVENIYDEDAGSQPLSIVLRSENKEEKGLGLPMPSGQVMVFEDSNYGPLLAGEATLADRAKGDEVWLLIGQSTDVRAIRTHISESGEKQKYKVVVSNARNEPVNVEIEIPYKLIGKPKHIPKIDGVPTWKATVPANGEATLYYELKLETDREQRDEE